MTGSSSRRHRSWRERRPPAARASPRTSRRGKNSTPTPCSRTFPRSRPTLSASSPFQAASSLIWRAQPMPNPSPTCSRASNFPIVPLLQPRLGSVEEWKFLNNNNDEHPIHIHVNDFQVMHYLDPTRGLETGPEMWAVDNANVPAPTLGPEESVIQQGALSLRMKFDDFTGLFVMHCHRLNHEDNGLMMLVNVIPAVSTYAVAVPGSKGHPAEVKIYDGNGDKLVATITPFSGFEGTLS